MYLRAVVPENLRLIARPGCYVGTVQDITRHAAAKPNGSSCWRGQHPGGEREPSERVRQLGAIDYLTRPLDVHKFVEILADNLSGRPT